MARTSAKPARKRAEKGEKKERPVFGPCSEKQRLILQDDKTDVLLCGGGAGGGKSHTCLTKALKFITDPAARVLITRRTNPMLKAQGGLIDESHGIYTHFDGEFNKQDTTWRFPNGATIAFRPFPDNLRDWQGLQATHILIDEAAEFTEAEIVFVLSRLRSAKYKGHKSVIMTCNPDRASFLYNWVEYSLDEKGVPLAGTEEVVRYWINIGGKMRWSSISVEDLWEQHGEPMGLNRDPALGPISFMPSTFRFIPLTIYDNPVILKNDPTYLVKLLGQPRVDQLRYLHGSWTARPENSGSFRREWVEIVDAPPINPLARVRSWDLAASIVSEVNRNPDWTVGVKMSRDKYGFYYVEDVKRFRKLADGVVKEMIRTGIDDGADCRVTIPKDPGAGGKTANQFHIRQLAEGGVAASSVQVSGHTGKAARYLPFCSLAEAKAVRVVKGDWNDDWFTELEHFEPDNRNQKDDQVDATSDAFNTLCKQVMLPVFVVPTLTQASLLPTVR